MGTGTGSEGLPWRPVTRRPHALQPPVLDTGAGPGLEQGAQGHLHEHCTHSDHSDPCGHSEQPGTWSFLGGLGRLLALGTSFPSLHIGVWVLKGTRGQWELRPAACSVLRALPHAPFANLPLFPLQTCLIQNDCSFPAMRKPGTDETEAERGQGRHWRLQNPAVVLAVAAGPVVFAHASGYGESQRSLSSPQQKEPHSCPFSRRGHRPA